MYTNISILCECVCVRASEHTNEVYFTFFRRLRRRGRSFFVRLLLIFEPTIFSVVIFITFYSFVRRPWNV